MTKALFLTADLGGNVPPTLAVADALSRRGVEVEIAGLQPGRTVHAQPPLPAATAIRPVGRPQGLREVAPMVRLAMSRATSAEVRALIAARRADVVIADCMLPAVIRGALAGGAPVVVLFHTFGEFWVRSFDRGPGHLLRPWGLRPAALWGHAAERLLLTDAELDPGRNAPALTAYTWTGATEVGSAPGALREPAETARRGEGEDVPRVLVALSSTDFPGMLRVYRRIVDALSGLPLEATVTTGGVDLGGELEGGPNVEVRGWADHGELLPHVDLMIGHGGHSSTMKALAHGVPLLVVPVNPTADQRLVGRTVQRAGLGRCLPRTAGPERIRGAVREILVDDELRARAAACGSRLRSLPPGAETAAGRILAVTEDGGLPG